MSPPLPMEGFLNGHTGHRPRGPRAQGAPGLKLLFEVLIFLIKESIKQNQKDVERQQREAKQLQRRPKRLQRKTLNIYKHTQNDHRDKMTTQTTTKRHKRFVDETTTNDKIGCLPTTTNDMATQLSLGVLLL